MRYSPIEGEVFISMVCGSRAPDDLRRAPTSQNQRRQNRPVPMPVTIRNGREMIADHDEDYGDSEKGIVLGTGLRPQRFGLVWRFATLQSCDHAPLRRQAP